MERLVEGWTCAWPKCDRAEVLHEDAEARIVIEWKRHGGYLVHWWRADTIGAFASLQMIKAMLDFAWGLLSAGCSQAVQRLSRHN